MSVCVREVGQDILCRLIHQLWTGCISRTGMLGMQEDGMTENDDREAEVQDALDTTDQLHNDISRLKRLSILTPEEDQQSKEHVDEIAQTLTEKLAQE